MTSKPVSNALFALLIGFIGIGIYVVTQQQKRAGDVADQAVKLAGVKPHAHDGLPNLFEVADGVFSGGQPDNETGFQSLQNLGIKTVVSVDGARPEVELAQRYGMQYVHLPHGYDGIENDHSVKLAKAVESLEGPIYIHCHHGKHRSPAAASVACIRLNRITNQDGLDFLKRAGTSPNYKGLYRSVATAEPLPQQILEQQNDDFPAVEPPSPIVESMISIDTHLARVSEMVRLGGIPPDKDPDMDAAHEALLLLEQFRELQRQDHDFEPAYGELMLQSVTQTDQLYRLLSQAPSDRFPDEEAEKVIGQIQNNCKTCHRKFRD